MWPNTHTQTHTHTQEYVWKNTGKFFLPRHLFSILCLNIHQTLFKVLSYKFSPGICLSQLPWEMLFFPFAIENFKLKEKKYLPKVSQLVSCKDKTQIQVSFDSKVHLCVVSYSSLTPWLKECGFFCELNKSRTGLFMCLSGGQGLASTTKVG